MEAPEDRVLALNNTLLYANWGWVGAACLFGVYGAIGLFATIITGKPTAR